MQWLDISLAPKDGTPVLLAGGDTGELDGLESHPLSKRPVVGFWQFDEWYFASHDPVGSMYSDPTHFALITPPADHGVAEMERLLLSEER